MSDTANTDNKPNISAIIPTKNGHATIARAIRSMLNQTLVPSEILIISDNDISDPAGKIASEELHAVIAANFANESSSENADARKGKIRIIQGPSKGPGIARNLGVEKATSDLIAFLDDDDIWSDEHKLEKQAAYLASHPDIDVVGAEMTFFIRENGEKFQTIMQPTDSVAVRDQMLVRNPLITSSVLMRRRAFVEANGFKPMYLAEDYDLWLRMNRKRNRIANAPGTSIEYTVREGSASQKRKVRMAYAVASLVFKNVFFYPNKFAIVKAKWPIFKRLLAEKLR